MNNEERERKKQIAIINHNDHNIIMDITGYYGN